MIYACPNCGHSLSRQLNDGLSHCNHCNRTFDSSDYNRLLSAAWMVRRERMTAEQLKFHARLPDDEVILVMSFVSDNCYSHEDFQKLLKKLGVANKSYINYSA